ncbi:MAG: thiosulfate oxidation carrier protein SoxY [Gammaproteobacteria bacterium]|jgi:sulfur-oxidizing protein SoxY|nr:thiosulfate oxidation carrier protein SoxY [Gammaproteobacteria bacterium]
MSLLRRQFMRRGGEGLSLAALACAGLLPPLLRAEAPNDSWPTAAFHAEQLDRARELLFGPASAKATDAILLDAPDIAENGRVVPVTATVGLTQPRSLALFSDENPFPLLALAHFTPAVAATVSVRVKLGASTNLIALAEAG